MPVVIAIKGAEGEKVVRMRRCEKVVPFVGADGEGKFAQVGVGILFPSDQGKLCAEFCGFLSPRLIIKSWRAMKLLEHVKCTDSSTLAHCWEMVGNNKTKTVVKNFGGVDNLQPLLDEILRSVPSADELNTMIMNLRNKGIAVDTWDLQKEITAKRLTTSPLIETMIREEQEEIQEYRRLQKLIDEPLPQKESLSTFFHDLAIANFIYGGGKGIYDHDWGHIKLGEIDREAKTVIFSEYWPNGFRLEHTTKGPETYIDPDDSNYTTRFGEVEQPHFVAKNKTKYTFIFAKFRNDHFYIKTKIEKSESEPIDGEFTISELREMIGPLPPKSLPRK